jgi:hypothetical protein
MKEVRLDCPYDFTSRCTIGECDCKPKQETLEEAVNAFKKTDVYINEIKQKQERVYSSENMTREQKLETIVKIFAKIMFYGDWKWETPNERVIEMLMRDVDLYPFPNEDAMIFSTKVDENLYVEARKLIFE